MPTRRSAAVAIAVTLQKLIDGKHENWTPDQALVVGNPARQIGWVIRGFLPLSHLD